MRDDLVFLLDEELTSIQLCALHMEMRNTEQLLASIGLLAYKVDSLKEANAALKNYGPESFHGDRITVKKKSDQQSAISKQNVHVSSMSDKPFTLIVLQLFSINVEFTFNLSSDKLLSCHPFFFFFSGPTEFEILQNFEEIVELALPLDKFKKPYQDVNTSKNLLLNRVTFCQTRVDVRLRLHYWS